MRDYLIAYSCILGINLLPAFGPPTWAVLVFFRLTGDLDLVPLVLGGAVAAASGRLVLAHGARLLRGRFWPERRASLAAAQIALTGNRRRTASGLALFAVSPVPSAQLFVAAGFLAVPLVPLTCAFFTGRLVSYSIYAGGATLARTSLEGVFTDVFASPPGIALQVLMLAALVALVRVDWLELLHRTDNYGPSRGRRADDSGGGRRDDASTTKPGDPDAQPDHRRRRAPRRRPRAARPR